MKANSVLSGPETERAALPETQAALIGTCLDYPGKVSAAIAAGITPRSFPDLRCAIAWRLISRMHADGLSINDVSFVERLKATPELNGTDPFSIVESFHAHDVSGEQISGLCRDLKHAELRRQLDGFADRLKAFGFNLDSDPSEVMADVESAWREFFATKGASDLPAMVDATSFVETPHPAPKEVIRGVLHQGSKLALGGGSKSFKTWMLLDLTLSVGHGKPWMGFETEAGPVLYLNFEIQDYAWHKRLVTVARAKEITLSPGSVMLWNLRGSATDFQTLLPRISAQVRRLGFVLIVVDPIYKLYGRADENKATDVAALLNGLETLAVETGAAIAFGAHFSKGNQAGKDAIDRISGSGVFARDPDSLLVFTRHEVDEAFSVECILRNFAPVPPFAVRWEFPLMRRDGELDPSRLKKAAGRPTRHAPEALLELLNGDSLASSEWQKRAKDEAGMSNGTFYALLEQLQKANRITKSVVTRKWIRISA
jgi:hypothetical protein